MGDIWRKFGGHLDEMCRKFGGKLEDVKRRLEGTNLAKKTLLVNILIKKKPCRISYHNHPPYEKLTKTY